MGNYFRVNPEINIKEIRFLSQSESYRQVGENWKSLKWQRTRYHKYEYVLVRG